MILITKREQPDVSFLNSYPLVAELEVKIDSPEPRALGSSMCRLIEYLSRENLDYTKVWYLRKQVRGVHCVGIHALREWHGIVNHRLDTWIASVASIITVTRLAGNESSGHASILKKLPFAVSDTTADYLVGAFAAACQLSANYLATSPDECLNTWGRIVFFVHVIQRACDALGSSKAAQFAHASFHRDWIVRILVLRAGKSDSKAREILQVVDDRAMALCQILAAEQVEKSPLTPLAEETVDLLETWLNKMVSACTWAEAESALEPLPDPFARDARAVVLLQLLHVLAQALDLQPLEEAVALTVVNRLASPQVEVEKFVLTRPALEPEPGPLTQSQDLLPTSHRAGWMLLVEAGGNGGREFLERFGRYGSTAYDRSAEALELLRRHELGAGRLERAAALLAEARQELQLVASETDPLRLLLDRFFLGSEAYFHYCVGEHALAEEVLRRAGASLERAINADVRLAPSAPLNADIPLQLARIARRRNDWNSVVHHLSLLADLETGRRPLHRHPNGTLIDYELIAQLCHNNPAVTEADRAVIYQYVAPEYRISRLNRWIRGFYIPKGLLILE